jgi:hypothetical protein
LQKDKDNQKGGHVVCEISVILNEGFESRHQAGDLQEDNNETVACITASLIVCASFSLSAGSVQKWVDEDGNVHYGDQPPAG